jgi:hypothetical protein
MRGIGEEATVSLSIAESMNYTKQQAAKAARHMYYPLAAGS